MPEARGGGGTSFVPFFDWAGQQESGGTQPLCIYFTDGYGSFPQAPPESSVLWVVMPGGLESTGFPFGDVARMVSPATSN
jgi:predicted metal-dependent peptidase